LITPYLDAVNVDPETKRVSGCRARNDSHIPRAWRRFRQRNDRQAAYRNCQDRASAIPISYVKAPWTNYVRVCTETNTQSSKRPDLPRAGDFATTLHVRRDQLTNAGAARSVPPIYRVKRKPRASGALRISKES